MIFDSLSNASKYSRLSENLAAALTFIANTNLQKLKPGKHQVEGDNILYIVDEYKTKPSAEGKLEVQKKYIDIHVVISGSEHVGHVLLSNQKVLKSYDEANDYALYDGTAPFFKLVPGSFAIFYPNDLHMPGIDEHKVDVKKLVMKVSI
jgi:YhcH/YjgK/YiaL family protein